MRNGEYGIAGDVPGLGTAIRVVDDLFSSPQRKFKNGLMDYLKSALQGTGMSEGEIKQFLDKFRKHLDTGKDQDIHGKMQEFLAGLASSSNPNLRALAPKIAEDIGKIPGASKSVNLSTLTDLPPVMTTIRKACTRRCGSIRFKCRPDLLLVAFSWSRHSL